jgi:DNA excision repair protein ERCC-4
MSPAIRVRVLVDTREPWPHPWEEFLPELWTMQRGTLETGDIALAALAEGVVIERKTSQDLASCMTAGRDRFERELKRGRYTGRFIVVVEGSFDDLAFVSGMHINSVVGTLASWTVRYCPFVFMGNRALAANFAFRSLGAQVRDIVRTAKA